MEKLFVYGSLGPGKQNEYKLKGIGGNWKKAYVWGELFEEGWGSALGYPGIRLKNKIKKIRGHVFYANTLADYWDDLDEFEGEAYERVKTKVYLEGGTIQEEAFIYVLKYPAG